MDSPGGDVSKKATYRRKSALPSLKPSMPKRAFKSSKTSLASIRKDPRMVQLVLDLGKSKATCRICGMSYSCGIDADESLHTKFHAQHLNGICMSLHKSTPKLWAAGEDVIVLCTKHEMRKAEMLIAHVNSELAAASVDVHALGSRMYIYIRNKRCVGVLVARRISSSYLLSMEGQLSLSPSDAILGVERIWTAATMRRQGIARRLLAAACENFIYGMSIEPSQVAFSQPSDSGHRLAHAFQSPVRVFTEQD